MIAMTGLTPEEIEKGITISPNSTLKSTNPDAKFYYVENGGGAIAAGERDLERTEEQMEVMGAQPFLRRQSKSTATGSAIDDSRATSDIQSWIRSLEVGIRNLYVMAAELYPTKLEVPDDFKIDIFSDFGITAHDGGDNEFLLKMANSGKLSMTTLIREVKRRGTISEDVNVEQEFQDIQDQMPLLITDQTQVGANDKSKVPNDNPPGDAPKSDSPAPMVTSGRNAT